MKRAKDKAEPTCEPEDHAQHRARIADDRVASEAFERAASVFRVAGDVARLKLLARLADGEVCVTELADAADAAMSTVSQQLRLLRAEHLVTRRRVGKHVYYALADSHIHQLIASMLAGAGVRRR